MPTWNQTPQGRELIRLIALKRETENLAARAHCTADEAAQRRRDGWRYCKAHGWFKQKLCIPCKTARTAQKRQERRDKAA